MEQVIAAYAGHLRKDQGLSRNTLLQYCPFAKAFLAKHFGTGSVDLSMLRALDFIEFLQHQADPRTEMPPVDLLP